MDSVNKSVTLTQTQNYQKKFIYTTVAATNISFQVIFSNIRTRTHFSNSRNEKLPIPVAEQQDIITVLDVVNSGPPISNSSEGVRADNASHRRQQHIRRHTTP
jgi:hypothetical protein